MDRRTLVAGLTGLAGTAAWGEAFAAIGDKQAQAALRQMLNDGTVASVEKLGKTDGYWGDSLVRIPLPKRSPKRRSWPSRWGCRAYSTNCICASIVAPSRLRLWPATCFTMPLNP